MIHGLDTPQPANVQVFHAGTALNNAGETVTAGGRVLAIAAEAENLRRAAGKAYDAASTISFKGMQMRRDIGHRALTREA